MQESAPPRTPDRGDPEGSAKSDEYETEESTEIFLKEGSDEEYVLPDSESEFENLRDEYEEHELEPEYQPSEEEEEELYVPSPSPEREVTLTPLRSTSKNAKRNLRRRLSKKNQRYQDQHNASGRRIEINERHRSKRGHPKLQRSTPPRAPTSSTEIMSDSDARANSRHSKQPKSRRESQESVEELDSQGRKMPTNKHRNRRH